MSEYYQLVGNKKYAGLNHGGCRAEGYGSWGRKQEGTIGIPIYIVHPLPQVSHSNCKVKDKQKVITTQYMWSRSSIVKKFLKLRVWVTRWISNILKKINVSKLSKECGWFLHFVNSLL